MRILALAPGGIGDQILLFPMLDDLKKAYPNAEIDVVVEPRAMGTYRVCKSVYRTISFDFQGRNSLADWGNLLGMIREREFDAAISLERSWISGFLLWLTGIPIRISYAGSNNQIFLTQSVPQKLDQYTPCMHHDLLKGLDIQSPCPDLAISLPSRDIAWAEAEQKRLGIAGQGYLLINSGTGEVADGKGADRYPAQSWQSIIQDFQRRQPDMPIVLVQSPAEQALVATLLKTNSNLKVTSPADLGKLAAMIAGASLMLCPAGVAMHLAVATQTFTLAFFGTENAKKLLPVSDRFVGIQSVTGKISDIDPQTILQKVWGG
jgi:ADP-heptose:LPS heptosyltransferase